MTPDNHEDVPAGTAPTAPAPKMLFTDVVAAGSIRDVFLDPKVQLDRLLATFQHIEEGNPITRDALSGLTIGSCNKLIDLLDDKVTGMKDCAPKEIKLRDHLFDTSLLLKRTKNAEQWPWHNRIAKGFIERELEKLDNLWER